MGRSFLSAEKEHLFKGTLDPAIPPALRIAPGDTVVLETVSAIAAGPGSFRDYCTAWGLDTRDPMIKKVLASVEEVEPAGRSGHVMTGPVYIEGAKEGDVLEVRILDMELTLPFGNIAVSTRGGAVPELAEKRDARRVEYDEERRFGELCGLRVPLDPFFGVMGVAPKERQSSSPPGRFGGNIDLKYLTKGVSVFFPVQTEGALFYAGDAHAAQGNGEVSMTAIETAGLTGTLRFELHKDMSIGWPMAETADSFIITGMDEDLDEAVHECVRESVSFLVKRTGLAAGEAIMLLSAAGDLEVTQVVDGVKGVHCVISKKIFGLEDPSFWNADGRVRYR